MASYISLQCKACEAHILHNKADENVVCKQCGAERPYDELTHNTAPAIISGTGFHAKIPGGFKEVLKHMKSRGGSRSTIDV